jgi:DNA-binding LacI/PurR family transcriptional regulator
VIGFDDAPVAAYADPPLTTVRQPVTDLGRTAARTLLRLIKEEQEEPLRQTLPTELIVRASCGHPFITTT